MKGIEGERDRDGRRRKRDAGEKKGESKEERAGKKTVIERGARAKLQQQRTGKREGGYD